MNGMHSHNPTKLKKKIIKSCSVDYSVFVSNRRKILSVKQVQLNFKHKLLSLSSLLFCGGRHAVEAATIHLIYSELTFKVSSQTLSKWHMAHTNATNC